MYLLCCCFSRRGSSPKDAETEKAKLLSSPPNTYANATPTGSTMDDDSRPARFATRPMYFRDSTTSTSKGNNYGLGESVDSSRITRDEWSTDPKRVTLSPDLEPAPAPVPTQQFSRRSPSPLGGASSFDSRLRRSPKPPGPPGRGTGSAPASPSTDALTSPSGVLSRNRSVHQSSGLSSPSEAEDRKRYSIFSDPAAGSDDDEYQPVLPSPPEEIRASDEEDDEAYRSRLHFLKKEFLSLEEKYVEGLNLVSSYYLEPMKEKGFDTGNSIVEEMFGSLLNIKACNVTFLNSLREAVEEGGDGCDLSEVNFGPALQSHLPLLRLYTSYINGYDALDKFFEQRTRGERDEALTAFLDSTQRTLETMQGRGDNRDVSLFGLLVTPIQQLMRYRLILERLIQNTRSSAPGFNLLKEAHVEVSNVCAFCNQRKKESDGLQRVIEIQEEWGFAGLAKPGRYWIMETDMEKLARRGRGTDRVKVFLFNDLLLCVRIRRGLTGELRKLFPVPLDSITDLYSGPPPNRNSTVLEDRYCFTVQTKSYTLVLILPTTTLKGMWFEAIRGTRAAYLRRLRYGPRKRSTIGVDLTDDGSWCQLLLLLLLLL
eukprot:Sspe_Gene.97207::Locus_70832_Transcript_2_2_Confidence_0.667_Length_1904::g.97207::m.97207